MGNKAVFLDRDGTIIEDRDYLSSVKDIEWIDGAKEAIKALCDSGLKVVVITNQSGVARGYFDEDTVQKIHVQLNKDLEPLGVSIHRFYYCPHHPEEGKGGYGRVCRCRKPNPGLVFRARDELDLDLEGSFFIGDNIIDVETGARAGLKPILVLTGKGGLFVEDIKRRPHLRENVKIFPSLREAATWILTQGPH